MATDGPVGRWGFVVENAIGDGRTQTGLREIRCNGCRYWFDATLHRCPECEHARPAFSKHIRTGRLNRHLFEHGRHALSEPAFARGITSNVPEAATS